MGIWEWIGSTAESVRKNTPDAWTPLKNGCKTSYSYGYYAVTKIDHVVKVNGIQRLVQWVPTDEAKLYGTKFAKNAGIYALQEGYKIIPGGAAFSKIISNTLNDVKHEKLIDDKLKLLENKLNSQRENSNVGTKLSDQTEKSGERNVQSESLAANLDPTDVIRVFMMKEFIGTRFLDNLIVPRNTRGKKIELNYDLPTDVNTN